MKYPSFSEQPDTDPGTLPCAELSAEFFEKGLDVIPGHVTAYRPAKNQCQCFTMFSFHDRMVLHFSTINKDKYSHPDSLTWTSRNQRIFATKAQRH
jgi:hypothetical protein